MRFIAQGDVGEGGFSIGTAGQTFGGETPDEEIEIGDGWRTGFSFVPDGVFHHVAVVNDKEANRATFYFDGVEESTTSEALELAEGPNTALGSHSAYPGDYLHGALDEVLIFGGALSAQQVRSLCVNRGYESVLAYLNTGLDQSLELPELIATGLTDDDWMVSEPGAASPRPARVPVRSEDWFAPHADPSFPQFDPHSFANAEWIGAHDQYVADVDGAPQGLYLFQFDFEIPAGTVENGVELFGEYQSDNELLEIFLNGVPLGFSGSGAFMNGYDAPIHVTHETHPGVFLDGQTNTLEIQVDNAGAASPNPVGLVFRGRVVPEPGVLVALSIGGAWIGLLARGRRRTC